MAELFGVKSQAITKHLGNIYEEEELTREATCSKKEQVQIEGGREVKRNFDFYNFDVILPETTNYNLAGDKAFSGAYEYIISHQWDKDRCDRMGQYLADNAVDKFTSMPEPVIVPAMVLIPFGIVLGLIGVALNLNGKYIIVSIIIDVVICIIRKLI